MKVGKWKMEVGKWKMEIGNAKLESGKWKSENGKWKSETRSGMAPLGHGSIPYSFKFSWHNIFVINPLSRFFPRKLTLK